jgi:hypothetical protein
MDNNKKPSKYEKFDFISTNAKYTESECQVCIVQCTGGCCWVCCGLILFFVLISYIPVSGITEAPLYARTLIYMSLGYACGLSI